MTRRVFCLWLVLAFVVKNAAFGELASAPDFTKFADAPVVLIVDRENMEVVRVGQDRRANLRSVRYLKGKGPDSLTIPEQMKSRLPAQKYIVFLNDEGAGQFQLASNYLSVLPVGEIRGDFEKDSPQALGEVLQGGLSSADFSTQCLSAWLLASAPHPVQQGIWKAEQSRITPAEWSGEGKAILPYLLVALCGEGSGVLNRLPSKGAVPLLADPGKPGEVPYQADVELAIATWVSRNVSTENAGMLLPFALAQPADFTARMLSGFARKTPVSAAGELLKRMDSPRNLREQYACLRVLANIFERPDLVPGMDSFMKRPQPYLDGVRKLLKEQGIP
jgi:hypothetical protein